MMLKNLNCLDLGLNPAVLGLYPESLEPCTALFLKKEISQFLKFWTRIYCVHQFFALFQMHIVSDLYFEVYKIVGE